MACSLQLLELFRSSKQDNNFRPTGFAVHCLDQDYSLDFFLDQVHNEKDCYIHVFIEQVGVICYLNFVKVCLDYDTHRDLGEVMKDQVPWDPGSSTWYRLEVKPKFKEGGMLATSPTLSCWAMGCHWWAWAALKSHEAAATNIGESGYGRLDWERTASASSALVFFFLLLCSSFLCTGHRSQVRSRRRRHHCYRREPSTVLSHK